MITAKPRILDPGLSFVHKVCARFLIKRVSLPAQMAWGVSVISFGLHNERHHREDCGISYPFTSAGFDFDLLTISLFRLVL